MSDHNIANSASVQPPIIPAPKHVNFMDLTGQRFGRLTVLGFGGVGSTGVGSYWVCRCECGNFNRVFVGHLRAGRTLSCGCLGRERKSAATKARLTIHGKYGTPEYKAYRAMFDRCENQRNKHYGNYGGRGIRVCDRWRESFMNFFADMGERPSAGHSIDRINNDGDYEPSNCRWATRYEQARNRRDNIRIECDGVSRTLSEWSEIAGLPFQVIGQRLRRGWSPDAAVKTPLNTMCTKWRGENHSRAKLTRDQAKAIVLAVRSGDKFRDVASRYGVTTNTIGSIINGHTWIGLLDEL